MSSAKTFQTESVNCFCDKNAPKVSKCDINGQKCINRFCTHAMYAMVYMSGNFQDCPETFQTVRKCFTLLEAVQTVQRLSKLSVNFPECSETFQTVKKVSRLSGKFSHCPEIWNIWNNSRISGKFSNCHRIFQCVWKFSRLSKTFPGCLENFHTVHIFSKLSGIIPVGLSGTFPDWPETFQTETLHNVRKVNSQQLTVNS